MNTCMPRNWKMHLDITLNDVNWSSVMTSLLGNCRYHHYKVLLFFFQFYKLFWTQACPEGIGTNGTHRSHARCHTYSIPQPVKVGHTTGVYVSYSFRTVVWLLLRPTRTDQCKCCEMEPTVFCPYPRRLGSLTICRCHYKGSTFFSVI